MTSISADHVSVNFPLLSESSRSLRRSLVGAARVGRIGIDSRQRRVVRALQDISFEFHEGDRVGLIGRNGAGKSTILRVLAGVYSPTTGICVVEGRVGSLLSLGFGMRDDATGYENIHLSGLLLGAGIDEVRERTAEIAEFCELGDHLYLNVGTYSSGMRARLAFSIATAFDLEILLIDEVFGTGDASFVKKAEDRMNSLVNRSHITIFASHSNVLVERLCNKAVLLDQGRIVDIGEVKDVISAYERNGAGQ